MSVDQPPGTGLSFVPTNGYLHELDQVRFMTSRMTLADGQGSQHLIQFMRNLYQIFPELLGVDVS